MFLTDEQVVYLLNKFILSESEQEWRRQRREDHKRWHSWLNLESIKTLPDNELKNNFLEYFNSGAGRHGFNAIFRNRIVKNIKNFRKTMEYLFNETLDIKERFSNVVEGRGEYHIDGVGKGLASSFLMDLDPDRYVTWNNRTDLGLAAIGRLPDRKRGDDSGVIYTKVLDELSKIKSLKPGLNFLDVDGFVHIVSAEEEGKEAVQHLTVGGVKDISEGVEQLSTEKTQMEFTMERYLEEFIETNFAHIDFGANLKLYQDEDNSGRQYPTPIGHIDLLAVDEKTDDFVIIELKKSRTGDQVIGQTLRYMGWVKDNLVNQNQKVRGIIVMHESDDRLKYALKMISNVDLYIYEVNFNLHKIRI